MAKDRKRPPFQNPGERNPAPASGTGLQVPPEKKTRDHFFFFLPTEKSRVAAAPSAAPIPAAIAADFSGFFFI